MIIFYRVLTINILGYIGILLIIRGLLLIITHRIHVCMPWSWFAIYHQYTPFMLAYIPYDWILWEWDFSYFSPGSGAMASSSQLAMTDWLVVWTLKNMKVNWDDYSEYMGKLKKWQPNHQPAEYFSFISQFFLVNFPIQITAKSDQITNQSHMNSPQKFIPWHHQSIMKSP